MNIDKKIANENLMIAYKKAIKRKALQTENGKVLSFIITGDHKTYRYILITALLAKSTDRNVDILSLQAGNDVQGSYDARSLCHDVIVPFERKFLKNAIGGSNEPFLNKPARFKSLSMSNAVRKGKDKQMLEILCLNLPNIKKSEDAMETLIDCLFLLSSRKQDITYVDIDTYESRNELLKSLTFIQELQKKSSEGEIPVAIIGSLLANLASDTFSNCKVIVHPVNQSGASSKEFSDIDVFQNDKLLFGNEIKDKSFSINDVTHACEKLMKKNANKLNFIYGINALNFPNDLYKQTSHYKNEGFILNIINIQEYISWLVTLTENLTCRKIFDQIMQISTEARFKEETKRFVLETAKNNAIIN